MMYKHDEMKKIDCAKRIGKPTKVSLKSLNTVSNDYLANNQNKCLSKSLTAQILTYVLSDYTKGNGNKEVRMRY